MLATRLGTYPKYEKVEIENDRRIIVSECCPTVRHLETPRQEDECKTKNDGAGTLRCVLSCPLQSSLRVQIVCESVFFTLRFLVIYLIRITTPAPAAIIVVVSHRIVKLSINIRRTLARERVPCCLLSHTALRIHSFCSELLF